jgi:hypothetical protein
MSSHDPARHVPVQRTGWLRWGIANLVLLAILLTVFSLAYSIVEWVADRDNRSGDDFVSHLEDAAFSALYLNSFYLPAALIYLFLLVRLADGETLSPRTFAVILSPLLAVAFYFGFVDSISSFIRVTLPAIAYGFVVRLPDREQLGQ